MKIKKLLITLVFVGLCTAGIYAYLNRDNSISAEAMVVKPGEVRQYVEDTAVVECKDKQTVYIEGSGKISDIKFDVGSTVKKGDLLFTIDDASLKLQLKDAESKIKAAKTQIDGTNINNYSDEIEIASVAVTQAEIADKSAARTLENAKALFDAGAGSGEDLNKAQEQKTIAETALKTASLQLQKAKKGIPDYIKRGYISQLEQAVILRDTLQRSIEKQQVRSQMNGVILEKLVEPYSIASSGTPAFTIGNTDALELEANILSDDSYKVQTGDTVEVTGKPLGDAVIKGKVTKIAPEARTITSNLGVNQKRVQVNIDLIGSFVTLKPGYNVDVKIITDTKKDIVAIPDSAVFDYEGKPCIFVLKDGKTVIRQVKKGLEGDDQIEITDGLNQGEQILIKPDNSIKEGTKIKPVK